MMAIDPAQIAAICGGAVVVAGTRGPANRVTTDSRADTGGAMFVALRGERFDGHDFAADAARGGAAILFVERASSASLAAADLCGAAVVAVDDTLAALHALAVAERLRHDPRVCVITGSNGKTTVKDFTRAVLGSRHLVSATRGNLNNHIGLPLSMLAMEPETTHAVWEIGMNKPGEIAALAALAKPDVAVVTSIGRAHIEFFGTEQAIADEKCSLYPALGADGSAVVSLDHKFAGQARATAAATGCRVLTVSLEHDADLRGHVGDADESGRLFVDATTRDGARAGFRSPLPGRHNALNALLALATGLLESIDLATGAAALESAAVTGGRSRVTRCGGVTVVDDTYNANPDSMAAALNTLAAISSNGRRHAILGSMGELGPHESPAYAETAALARRLGIDTLCSVGPAAAAMAETFSALGGDGHSFPDHESCAAWLRDHLADGDVLLAKGSRSARMERVLALLGEGVPA